MPRTVIIACEMIEDEVQLALEALAPEDRPPVVWVESRLHDRPELLKAALQRLIDLLDEGSSTGNTVSFPPSAPASARRQSAARKCRWVPWMRCCWPWASAEKVCRG